MVLKNLILISPSSPNIFLKLGLPKNSFCKVAFDNCVGALKLLYLEFPIKGDHIDSVTKILAVISVIANPDPTLPLLAAVVNLNTSPAEKIPL